MSNDELYKGMLIFKDGLSQFNQSKALESANKKLADLNNQQLEAEAKLQAQTQIQNELASRLGMAGADPGKIQALTQNIAPSAGAQYQASENSNLQEKSQNFQAGQADKQRAHDREMQQMKIDALGVKDSKKEAKLMAGFADKFRKENKDTLDARDKMVALEGILDKTPDRVGVEMAKTGLLKFAGEDRVSDTDVARAQRDPSLRAGIARKLKLELTGEALKDDRKFYKAIFVHAQKTMDMTLKKKVKGYSDGTAELAEVDGTKLKSGLYKQLNLSDDKEVTKKLYSPKSNKTKLIFSDGSEQVVDGKQ